MKVSAYAKVNLTLEVLGTRSDGYHALRSVVMPIALADELTIEPTSDGTLTSDSGFADDLCLKAARVLRRSRGDRPTGGSPTGGFPTGGSLTGGGGALAPASCGAAIRIAKRIPVGGGLGGGSADAAATLVALNDLWHMGLTRTELATLGAQVGSDVPALVLAQAGVPVLMEGRGETVAPLFETPSPAHPCCNMRAPLHLVLANPGVFCSTPEVFKKCNSRVTDDPSILYNMRVALRSGDPARVAASLQNDLEAPAIGLHPEIGRALEALKAAGVLGARMSGSGSTVFGIVRSEAEGQAVAAHLEAKGLKAWSVSTVCPVV